MREDKNLEDSEVDLSQIQITTSVETTDGVSGVEQVTRSSISSECSSEEVLKERVDQFECRMEAVQDLKGKLYEAMKALEDSFAPVGNQPQSEKKPAEGKLSLIVNDFFA